MLVDPTDQQIQRAVCATCRSFAPREYHRCKRKCDGTSQYKPKAANLIDAAAAIEHGAYSTAYAWGLQIKRPGEPE